MSEEAIAVKNKNKGKRSTQPPLDGEFTKWIERLFRGGESAQSVDAYPLYRARDREQRLYHYDIKADEKISADRAVELSNIIYSDCQLHCDALPRSSLSKDGTKSYEVAVIDERRGGQAKPVGTKLLTLSPRVHRPAPTPDSEEEGLSAEDGDALSARKMMLETFKEITGRDERRLANMAASAGDTMLLLKDALKDREQLVMDMFKEVRLTLTEFRQMATDLAQRRVEEQAVAIDAQNAVVDREFRRAQLAKDTMWTDVTRAGLLESINVVSKLIPGFGQLFAAMLQGKPLPPPPQLPNTGGSPPAVGGGGGAAATLPANATGAPTTALADPTERALVDSFVTAAEQHKIDETYTVAEKLFGKDDENGKQIEGGVFTREQVAILAGVRAGSLAPSALDALLADSGKPEAVNALQMARAMAFLTPAMLQDISKFMSLRNAARKGASHGG